MSSAFCFANSLDAGHEQQMTFLEGFIEKANVEKNQQMTNKHAKITHHSMS